MSLRDPSAGRAHELPNMTLLVADALRETADDGGLTLAELEAKVGTRWALRHIYTLNRSGFNVGEDDGRYVLVHDPEREAA